MRLIHGVLHTIEDGVIEDGSLEIEEGKICALGPTREARPGDLDLRGAHVLPGFVDAHTCLGLKEDSLRYEGNDWNEVGSPVNPQLCAWDGFNPDDRAVGYALQGGVTCVGVAPGNVNLIGGQVSAVKLCRERPDQMLLRRCCGLKMSLGEAPKNAQTGPVTRMAELAMLRGALCAARIAMDAGKAIEKSSAIPALLRGEIPAFVHAQRADDILSAVRLGAEFGFRTVIVHGADAPLVGEALRQSCTPVVAGALILAPSSYESRNMDLDLPCRLKASGVRFAITTDHHQSPIQMLSVTAALAVRDGLDVETALRSVTIEPARILGVEARLGSLRPGKDADLAIYSGHPFHCRSRLLRLLIDGRAVDLQR